MNFLRLLKLKVNFIFICLYQFQSLLIVQERVEAGQQTASYLNNEELELQRIAYDYINIQKQTWVYWLDYLKSSGMLSLLWQKN
jgi:hypothetical protein